MDNLIINVNSKFADLNKYTSTNFVYDLEDTIKNVAYIKLGSIELPLTNYNYLEEKKNISFKIGDDTFEETVTIQEGNYTSDNILLEIQDKLNIINGNRSKNYTIDVNINSGKIFFNSDDNFILNFTSETSVYNKLGVSLGFENDTYSGTTTIIADNVINLNPHNYYFLKLNNIDNVKDKIVKNSFAKIIKNVGNFNNIIEGKDDYVTKEKIFRSPINLSRLEIQIVDFMDRIIDLNGHNFSFTLEVGFIYDKKLYENIKNKGIPNGDLRLKYFY